MSLDAAATYPASEVIWPDCDTEIAGAITAFLNEWGPYSPQSRNHSIFRLFEQRIDPAWHGLVSRFACLSPGVMQVAWTKFQFYRVRSGSTIVGDTVIDTISKERTVATLHEFDSLALIGRKFGFSALERFIYFLARHRSPCADDIALSASLDSLRELARVCGLKEAKRRKREGVDVLRGTEICRLCDKPTELHTFLLDSSWPQQDQNLRLRLSAHYCEAHKPKEAFSEKVRSDYLRAKRNEVAFDQELSRLDFQSWAGPANAHAKSGNPLVDEFFRLLSSHRQLTYEQQPLDKQESLKTRLRWEARMLVDQRITDRKKEIIALLAGGLNQAQAAERLGVKRQAISKTLQSVRSEYRLDLL